MVLKAIIFDFGGVLYKLPDRSRMRRWQKLLNLKDEEALTALIAQPNELALMMDVLTGRVPEEEMWAGLAKRFHIRPELMNRIRRASMSKRQLNRELADYLSSLRGRFTTVILSNAGTASRAMFSDVYGLDKISDLMVISAEEGVAKPDEKIYQITLDRLGIEPQEALFLDDMIENVESARSLGMHAVHFENNEQAKEEVGRLIEELGQ